MRKRQNFVEILVFNLLGIPAILRWTGKAGAVVIYTHYRNLQANVARTCGARIYPQSASKCMSMIEFLKSYIYTRYLTIIDRVHRQMAGAETKGTGETRQEVWMWEKGEYSRVYMCSIYSTPASASSLENVFGLLGFNVT